VVKGIRLVKKQVNKSINNNCIDMTNTKLNVPGPGAYKSLNGLTQDGKYFFSKFKSSGSTALKGRANRFEIANKMKALVPGPGNYNHPETITKQGKHFISRFESSSSMKFSHSIRKSELDPKKSIISYQFLRH
jgi:hypothetical protein